MNLAAIQVLSPSTRNPSLFAHYNQQLFFLVTSATIVSVRESTITFGGRNFPVGSSFPRPRDAKSRSEETNDTVGSAANLRKQLLSNAAYVRQLDKDRSGLFPCPLPRTGAPVCRRRA